MTTALEPLEHIVSSGHNKQGGHGHDHGPKTLPEAAEKFYKKRKLADKLADTTHSIYTKVYSDMEDALLQDENGRVDYSKLDDEKTKEKAQDMLYEGFKKHASRAGANIKKNMDEDETDIVLNKYFGITKDSIKARLKNGKKYSSSAHESFRDEHVKSLRLEMESVTRSHFSKDDIESVLEYIGAGADEMFDKIALRKNPGVLAVLLEHNRENKGQGVPYDKITDNKELRPYLNPDYMEKEVPTSNKEVEKQKKEHEKHAHAHGGHAPTH